jgi:hypothetical protein
VAEYKRRIKIERVCVAIELFSLGVATTLFLTALLVLIDDCQRIAPLSSGYGANCRPKTKGRKLRYTQFEAQEIREFDGLFGNRHDTAVNFERIAPKTLNPEYVAPERVLRKS